MSSEFDKDIDSLLREGARRGRGASVEPSAARHAGGSVRATPSGAHLDADELNAYAENALPAAARAHHTAHLADCDDCRRSVTSLALAAGMPAQLEQREAIAATAQQKVTTNAGWRERFGALFAPRAWRYAVPALALLLVGAVTLVVFMRSWQSGTETSVAQSDASERAKPSLAQTEQNHATQQNSNAATATTANPNESAANAPNSNATVTTREETAPIVVDGASGGQPLPKPGIVVSEDATPPQQPPAPVTTGSGALGRSITEMPMPTPLPPPVAEPVVVAKESEAKVKSAESVGEVAAKDAPQKQADYENMQREQAANARRAEKLSGPRRNNEQTRNSRGINADDSRDRADKADKNDGNVSATAGAPASPAPAASRRARQRDADKERDETKPSDNSLKSESRRAPESTASGETRAVGGRRFRKQGGAWIDTAYSAGQSYTVVRRNSEQYRALVADEPAIGRIADSLGGEVTIVWKGRAYRIR
ncbi:MAG TPA: hypothetical protein VJ842_15105 [Pyrinomonadaceae bacterium]|nr:hypothetical protein [Pyrinomonadaceae bacterium]